jgi:hypothetical protein
VFSGFVIYSSVLAFLLPGILLAALQAAIFIRKNITNYIIKGALS